MNFGELAWLCCKYHVYLFHKYQLFGVLPGNYPRQSPQLQAHPNCDGGATDQYVVTTSM